MGVTRCYVVNKHTGLFMIPAKLSYKLINPCGEVRASLKFILPSRYVNSIETTFVAIL